jgi:hypothetical protein
VLGRRWTPANELMAGDRLRSHNALAVVVDRVSALDDEVAVYNVRAEDYHTYFVCANGSRFYVLAHNSECVLFHGAHDGINCGQFSLDRVAKRPTHLTSS